MSEPNIQKSPYLHYLDGGGEMGRLTREFDWSKTVLGKPETWSQSLLTTVSIILNSRFPMFLWWGPSLIQFYNDAYRPSLGQNGKHPTALGQKAEDCWPEIWTVIKPLIDQVMQGGQSTWSEDQLIPIYRNGKLENVYWTFSYSRVNDETGEPAGVLVICSETTDKINSYNNVKNAKQDLEFANEAAELGTWDLNPITNHFIGNKRLKEWFGLPVEEDIDLDLAISAIAEEDQPRVVEAIQRAIAPGSDGNYNIVYTVSSLKDQTRSVLEVKGKALFDEEGRAYRFSGIAQDVTEAYRLQQRKDEFISVASHELKTPITSLSASMQILQKLVKNDPSSEKIPTFVNKANNNLSKLINLLDDLLNVTKIQQGQLALNITRFDIVALIRDCCDYINFNSEHEFVLMGEDEVMIFADYRRIYQVMINLIGNAVKYSPQSNRVEITVYHDEENVTVSVRDFGIGINPEKLPHLFDRYYRVDAFGHQFSGLGLGLYITAEIVQRHNGKIAVDSNLGSGSNFWFSLPMDDRMVEH
ncbi:ATP-binding protein [Mucilaginibacter calamicampi]|uniref:histidine kinase n=1 Tax=Mucilaginibacter calamicampi TaxID=1302352 RepID=A0ABW2YXV6_9SPHI